jgi:hypothetical protein
MGALGVIEVRGCAGAQAFGGFFRVGLVGLRHQQARARGPGAAEIGVFGDGRIERRNRIAAIEADEIERVVVVRHGGGGFCGGEIAVTVLHGGRPIFRPNFLGGGSSRGRDDLRAECG